jgi:hypothetical protein
MVGLGMAGSGKPLGAPTRVGEEREMTSPFIRIGDKFVNASAIKQLWVEHKDRSSRVLADTLVQFLDGSMERVPGNHAPNEFYDYASIPASPGYILLTFIPREGERPTIEDFIRDDIVGWRVPPDGDDPPYPIATDGVSGDWAILHPGGHVMRIYDARWESLEEWLKDKQESWDREQEQKAHEPKQESAA